MKWLWILIGPAAAVISWWTVKLFIHPSLTLPPKGVMLKMLLIGFSVAVVACVLGVWIGGYILSSNKDEQKRCQIN